MDRALVQCTHRRRFDSHQSTRDTRLMEDERNETKLEVQRGEPQLAPANESTPDGLRHAHAQCLRIGWRSLSDHSDLPWRFAYTPPGCTASSFVCQNASPTCS